MRILRRGLCLLCCLLLFPLPALGEDSASAPTVRIYLKRLNLTDRVDLWLDGVYTASTGGEAIMAFPQGSQITLQVRGGSLYLFYQGMSLQVGTTLQLIQNQSGGSGQEGLRFADGGNLYPGTLRLTVENGLLIPVLTLSVEDYLMGVVPYEMSNLFPLEALKAQAVCARTYALAHLNPSAAYDMVDTTTNQVFRGINPANLNAIRAIKETAGVVGSYNGELATCYYAASNGGQTELVENVWSGGGDWGYYRMADDPYDLENPESPVKRARLNKSGSNLPDAFHQLLSAQMAARLTQQGFATAPEAFRVDGITAMSLGAPRNGEGSRLMTELTLTFTWSGRRLLSTPSATAAATANASLAPANDGDEEIFLFATATPAPTPAETVNSLFAEAVSPTPTPAVTPDPTPAYGEWESASEPCTLTLSIFPAVLRALNLSISGSDNEIVTLSETEDTFVLEARRYGHGVGMSQRGAQWMAAKYGKNYAEILAFYYPGMTLMRAPSGALTLPTARAELAQTPGPAATPTPRPTLMPVTGDLPEGAYLAQVTGIDDDSSLNLRAEPNTSADILRRLYKHQQLVVLPDCQEEGWVHVRTDVIEGYVMSSFLEKLE